MENKKKGIQGSINKHNQPPKYKDKQQLKHKTANNNNNNAQQKFYTIIIRYTVKNCKLMQVD